MSSIDARLPERRSTYIRRVKSHMAIAGLAALALHGCDDAAPAVTDAAPIDAAPLDALVVDDLALTTDDRPVDPPRDVPPPIDLGSGPIDPASWPVDRPGPYRVGYRTFRHTYTPRGSSTPRTIPLHIWYPTLVAEGAHPTYALIFRDTESFIDAPPAPPAHPRGYPVHVYSHGHQGFGPTSHFLMRYFASHGWISVAPDHIGNTLLDTPDPRPVQIYYWRSLDVSAALDAVSALPPSDPLSGRLDARAAILSGHSFGVHTLWASAGATFDVDTIRPRCTPKISCTEADLAEFGRGVADPRFAAVIPMAGSIDRSWFGASGHRSVRVPVLSMSGTLDPVGADTQFDSTSGVDLTWIDVRGGCHQFFALGHCPMIDDALQAPIVGTYALAFARRHLLSDADPAVRAILDGTRAVHERVTFRHHPSTP